MMSKDAKKIKIVYLVDFLRTIQAGTEKQLSFLLKHLPEDNYDINLVSFQDSPFLKQDANILFPLINITTLQANADISKTPRSIIGLFFLLRRLKADIVHTYFTTSNTMGIIIAAMAGVRYRISSRRDMGFNVTNADLHLLRFSNRFASRIIVNAECVKQRTIECECVPPNRVNVIYNAISINDWQDTDIDQKRGGHPIVGIVANLNRPVKKVDLFIKAAAIVKSRNTDAAFYIIGDGYLRAGLEKLASDLGLGSSVSFLGRQDDVQHYLQNMTVGVICSDSEGLSNAIMEYMAACLPVVATDVGGNRELVQHAETGVLVPPNNEEALAFALLDLLSDRDKCKLMGRTGYEYIQSHFSLQKMLMETLSIYETAITGE
jgi:L-malate glycosyltransferase